jgi:hypothetical protein
MTFSNNSTGRSKMFAAAIMKGQSYRFDAVVLLLSVLMGY